MTVTLDGDDGQTVTGITEAIGDGAQARADVVFNTCDADECLVVSTVTLTSSSPITTSTQLFVTATINLIDTQNDAPQPELRVDAVPRPASR
jgi:hypothetical protein